MKIEYRLMMYTLALAVGTWVSWRSAIAHSQAAYDAGDMSAFAWTGFAPFILPIMFLESAMYVVPIALFVEFLLLLTWLSKVYGKSK